MNKKFWNYLAFFFLGIITAAKISGKVAPYFLGGRTLEGRSLVVQVFLFILIWLILSLIYFLLLKLLIFLYEKSLALRSNLRNSISHNKILFSGWNSLNKLWGKTAVLFNDSPRIIVILYLIVFLILGAILYAQVKIIIFPYPLELRESAQELTTHALLKGINPYALENNPIYIDPYGIFYHLCVLPFAMIFGNSLQLHRILNAFFILGQAVLLLKVLKAQSHKWLTSLILIAFIWLSQLFYVTPLARPDTLGELLFLATIIIPFLDHFNNSSLAISIIVGIISFYTKVYFFFGVAIIASYLFLFISKRKAIFYAAISGTILFLSALVINKYLETYFANVINVIFAQPKAYENGYVFTQLWHLFQDYWGLFIIGIGAIIVKVTQLRSTKFNKSPIIIINNFDTPFLSFKMDFVLYCLSASFLVVFFILGRNTGTFMTYLYQFISPFFVLVILNWVDGIEKNKKWLYLIVVITLLSHAIAILKPDFTSFSSNDWQKLEERIEKADQILNSPLDVSLLLKNDKVVTTSGLTQYSFYYPAQPFFLYPSPEKMKEEGAKYINRIKTKIMNQEYDFLETFETNWGSTFAIGVRRLDPAMTDQDLISIYYHRSETLVFNMPHTYQVWKIGIWEPN